MCSMEGSSLYVCGAHGACPLLYRMFPVGATAGFPLGKIQLLRLLLGGHQGRRAAVPVLPPFSAQCVEQQHISLKKFLHTVVILSALSQDVGFDRTIIHKGPAEFCRNLSRWSGNCRMGAQRRRTGRNRRIFRRFVAFSGTLVNFKKL